MVCFFLFFFLFFHGSKTGHSMLTLMLNAKGNEDANVQMQKKKNTERFLEGIIHECSSDDNFASRRS